MATKLGLVDLIHDVRYVYGHWEFVVQSNTTINDILKYNWYGLLNINMLKIINNKYAIKM